MQFIKREKKENQPYNAVWIVEATWAHPFWHTYRISLCDLETYTGTPAHIYKEDVTHEVVVNALDSEHPVPEKIDFNTCFHPLTPPNHVYQFKAESDEKAEERINDIVRLIENRELSPDTDFTTTWDEIFSDGVSLKK